MGTTAAEQDVSKDAKGSDGATWGARGDKRDPDLERISGLSYLIVDDSRFARATIKNVLHVLGIRNLAEAESAEQALNELDKHPIDIVITDFEMPGMSGAEFTWRLRRSKNERLQQIPVVMVSTHADESHIRLAINAGVNEFLPKPFSQADILMRVKRSVISPKPFIVAEGYVGPDRRFKDRDGATTAEQSGLRPVLIDCTGAEPKKFEVGKDGLRPIQPAAQPEAQPETQPEPQPEEKHRFSATAETSVPAHPGEGGLPAAVGEKLRGLAPKEN